MADDKKKTKPNARKRTTRKKAASSRRSTSGTGRKTEAARRSNSGTGRKTEAARRSVSGRAGSASPSSASPKRQAVRKRKARLRRRKRRILILMLALLLLVIGGIVFLRMNTHHERISQDGYTHDPKFNACLVVDGIDVSTFQGKDINFRSVKNAGIDFVFIRAGYRSSDQGNLKEDTEFKRNIKAAKKAGLMTGLYLYSQALNEEEARKEADYLIGLAADYEIDLPLVMDYELLPDGRLDKAIAAKETGRKKMYRAALAFCEEVEAAGYESMVYSNYGFLEKYLNPEELQEHTNVWMAHYDTSTDYPYDYSFWQCSGSWQVQGISKDVDKDFWYLSPKDVYKTRGARNKGARSIGKMRVEIKKDRVTYIGFQVRPALTVYDGIKPLKEGTDYRVSAIRNTGEGTGYVIITGLGDYKDAVALSFEIQELL